MEFAGVIDPSDLISVKQAISSAASPEKLVSLDIKHLHIGENALESMLPICHDLLSHHRTIRGNARIMMLSDTVHIRKGTQSLKQLVHDTLADSFNVQWCALESPTIVKVDDASIRAATDAAEGCDLIVGVGGGSISDIGKLASAAHGGIPLVHIQTAASVDGYTDNVSVVMRHGVKRTVASRWPDAVIADLEVIRDAPLELNLAGFGEALSLFTAPADWELAHFAGLDDTFHSTPRDLLLAFAKDPRSWARGLDKGHPDAVLALTNVLAIRGIGTGIAGTTACLSGVEHLVSHMLDIRAVATGNTVGLHGAQVGAASLIGAAAWEYLFQNLEAMSITATPDMALIEADIREAFGGFDSTGNLIAECSSDVSRKVESFAENRDRVARLLDSWREHPQALRALVPDLRALAEGLKLSGAPATAQDLEQWITPEVWEWSIRNCHLMRNRFTVVDLLFFAGRWTSTDTEHVMALAASALEG
jgi:glycerol-1-phosphate dehydrogenase [NAD(P)+]